MHLRKWTLRWSNLQYNLTWNFVLTNNFFKLNNLFWRTWHRRLAILFVVPLVIVAASGFLLSVRSYVPTLQPPQMKSDVVGFPAVSLEDVWEKVRLLPEAEAKSLQDLKSVEFKLSSGVLNLRFKNGQEVQVDAQTGKILSNKKRWTNLLVQLHEGTFLPEILRNIIFVPVGLILLFLSGTGIYLAMPFLRNKKI
ncbi:MAG: PepSY domain-containing protein [Bdellovibrio sp.]